jgi:hypothetical protein
MEKNKGSLRLGHFSLAGPLSPRASPPPAVPSPLLGPRYLLFFLPVTRAGPTCQSLSTPSVCARVAVRWDPLVSSTIFFNLPNRTHKWRARSAASASLVGWWSQALVSSIPSTGSLAQPLGRDFRFVATAPGLRVHAQVTATISSSP